MQLDDAVTRDTVLDSMQRNDGTTGAPLAGSNRILVRRDGFEISLGDTVAPIHDRKGNVTGAAIVLRGVSEARTIAVQMEHSAKHHFLTGLPNRMLVSNRISQAIAFARRHARSVAVLFLDLDGFKLVNDTLGHAVGDKLLQSVAARLVECVRATDTVCRQGGDEFAVLLADVELPDDATTTASRILHAISEPHWIDGNEMRVTTSIGMSVYPDDGIDSPTLIKYADTAMYHAKSEGRQLNCGQLDPLLPNPE